MLSVPALPKAVDKDIQLSGKVLLVEDHPVNQKVAQKLLERLGLKVDLAEHGEAALDKLHATAYSLVLMDCQMPVLDGYSATRRLREIEVTQRKPRIPVIAMTAHAMAGDRERCLQAGMDDYLAKPLDRKLLAETLARWLQKAPKPATPRTPQPVAAARAADSLQVAAGRTSSGDYPAVSRDPWTADSARPAKRAAIAVSETLPADTLDTTTLVDLEDIMGEEVAMLVDAYLRDGSTRMQNLRAAADRGDSEEVGKLAHSLKSASANLGAVPLANRARQVEEAARKGTLANPVDSVDALEKLYANAAAALKARYKCDRP